MKIEMERFASMTENRTEQELLAACRSGDRRAFESLYVQNQKRVFSVALSFFGGDEERAKDITQQVFLKIYGRVQEFRGQSEFTTWLYRITVNTCLDEARKLRPLLALTDFLGVFGVKRAAAQDEKVHRREICDEVQKAVGKLKPKFRLPILLKYVEGLSYEEIARVLDCSTGTVASRLNRGHKMLAGKLGHLKDEI
ncbi:MAG TPA: sigma-70 family RNA polymerase sigma factor [Pyrinomonadaceae bacterium]|nr:sigma-70 family RNA polymerase sigma factor [Pyrinomonadaceae bacterium]